MATFTNINKSSAPSFSNTSKNSASFSNTSKNTSTFSNTNRSSAPTFYNAAVGLGFVLLESGSYLLSEDGYRISLEQTFQWSGVTRN